MTISEHTQTVKNLARAAGFQKVGIAKAKKLSESDYLTEWLAQGRHGEMRWMEQFLEKRLDVRQFYPGAQAVIMVAHNYFSPEQHSAQPQKGKISRYAWGRDYHKIIKKKLKHLLRQLQETIPGLEGRIFTDTAPIQEKLWAAQAGLGWQGKHTNIVSRDLGSWFFLGGIVINKELEYDRPAQDYCGSCTACIDACPTGALTPYQLDARRCISYLTIEYWDRPLPEVQASALGNWIFGCDICQDVCPWNRKARPTAEISYRPAPENIQPDLAELSQLTEEEFKKRFKKTPVFRAKYANFMRNVFNALQNSRQA